MDANRKRDAAAIVALVCIFFGWFLIDTLAVTFGSLRARTSLPVWCWHCRECVDIADKA